jgi:hypothetical protein
MVRVVARLHGKTDDGRSRRQRNADDRRDEGDGSYDNRALHTIILRRSKILKTMTWTRCLDRPSSTQRGQRAWKVNEPTWKWTAQPFLAMPTKMIVKKWKNLRAATAIRSVLRQQPKCSSARNRKWLLTGQIDHLLALLRERLPRRR